MLFQKVLGVIGFGKIESIVADRARGLKIRVIVYDPFVTRDLIKKGGFECIFLETLYLCFDYIRPCMCPNCKTPSDV